MKKIFENDLFIISDTEQDYDFKYVIQNKNKHKIYINLNPIDDYLEIEGNNWVGLLHGDYSDDIVNILINKEYSYNKVY